MAESVARRLIWIEPVISIAVAVAALASLPALAGGPEAHPSILIATIDTLHADRRAT